jgi:Flp pilus assembly protein TadD
MSGDEDPGEAAEARAFAIAEGVAEAQSLGEQERWTEAHELLSTLLEEQGEDVLVLTWLGLASERLGEEGEAYERFRRVLALEPVDAFVLAAAGSGVARLDDPAAEPALRMAALTAPDFPFARAAYGAYLAREGMIEEAIGELEAARTLAPEDAGAHTELGVALLLAGRHAEGIAALEEAIGFASEDSWLRALLGVAMALGDRAEEGAELLHQAAGEREEDVEVQLLAALAMAAEGWDDPAWEAVARAEAWAEGSDREMIAEVEDRLELGPEAAAELLRVELGPSLLRERLRQRG